MPPFHVKILIRLRHLLISDAKEFLMPFYYIGNNREVLKDFFSDDESIKALGTLDIDSPYEEHDFIYSVHPLDKEFDKISDRVFEEQNVLTDVILAQVDNFIAALWYVKDNSVSIHKTISALVQYQPSIRAITNFVFFTDSEGKFSSS